MLLIFMLFFILFTVIGVIGFLTVLVIFSRLSSSFGADDEALEQEMMDNLNIRVGDVNK